jgi:hypothetical protein
MSNSREAFEKWWPSVGQTIGKVAAWEAWQAALQHTPQPVVTKTQISEAIFGWGLRNDDGDNLSMDDTDDIAEYIVTSTPQPVVPEGYVLVPMEPTPEMLSAGIDVALWSSVHGRGGWNNYIDALYKAMLSAGKETVSDADNGLR